MSSLAATPPSVSWAQSKSLVFLTFNVECKKPEIKIDELNIYFKGLCGPDRKLHEVNIPLYANIDPDKSQQNNKGRVIELVLVKSQPEKPFWESLTSDKKKHHWLKVDFNRWVDDEDSDNEVDDMNDMFKDCDLGDDGLDDTYDEQVDDDDSSEDEDKTNSGEDDNDDKVGDVKKESVGVKEDELKEKCGDAK